MKPERQKLDVRPVLKSVFDNRVWNMEWTWLIDDTVLSEHDKAILSVIKRSKFYQLNKSTVRDRFCIVEYSGDL